MSVSPSTRYGWQCGARGGPRHSATPAARERTTAHRRLSGTARDASMTVPFAARQFSLDRPRRMGRPTKMCDTDAYRDPPQRSSDNIILPP